MKKYKIKAVERNEWFFTVEADNKEDAHNKAFTKWQDNNYSFEHMKDGKTNTFFEVEQ